MERVDQISISIWAGLLINPRGATIINPTPNDVYADLCMGFGNACVWAGVWRIKNLANPTGIRCNSA